MKETLKLHWLKIDQEIKAQNSSVCVFVYSLTCSRMRNATQYSKRIRIILKQKRKSSFHRCQWIAFSKKRRK